MKKSIHLESRSQKRSSILPSVVLLIIIIAGLYGLWSILKLTTKETVYVANEGDGTISVIDAKSRKVINTIELSGMPHNVNVDPKKRFVYATNHEGEEEEQESAHDVHAGHIPYLRIIDAETNKLYHSTKMEEMAAHVVPSRDADKVFVSIEGSNSIVEVDIPSGEIIRKFYGGDGPHGIVLNNANSLIFAPNMRSNDLSIFDVSTGQENRIPIKFEDYSCDTPVAMGITNDDKFAFVTCGRSFDIYKIDALSRKVVNRIALVKGEFPGPIQIPVHPNNRYIYVPEMRRGLVHKININSFTIEKEIPTGAGAHGIAFSENGKLAYVTNTWDNTASIINLETDSVIATIPVGSKPNGVAVMGGKNQGW